MLIDYSLFHNERELLELRYHVLKNHVDKFVVCEQNKTFSGIPKTFQLKNIIRELGLPEDKFHVIEYDVPEDKDIEIEDHDVYSMYPGDEGHHESIIATSRERLSRNALMSIIDQFNDGDYFIMSDIDEIINPKYISYALMLCNYSPDVVFKFPLINLYGEADLRAYYKNGTPVVWRKALSIVSKKNLILTTPHRIRCEHLIPFNAEVPKINGQIFDEFGWHFSWMGGTEKVLIKSYSYGHAQNKGHIEHRNRGFRFKENESLTWDDNSILLKFPHDQLPKEIFELPNVLKYLLPRYKKYSALEVLDMISGDLL